MLVCHKKAHTSCDDLLYRVEGTLRKQFKGSERSDAKKQNEGQSTNLLYSKADSVNEAEFAALSRQAVGEMCKVPWQ